MNIVLIGMRGSGKTTIAKLLSEKLNKPVVETDELVVKRVGQPIPALVKKHGWDHFRMIESHIVREVSSRQNVIISTGGGVVTKPKNIRLLKHHGKLVYLATEPKTLEGRIGNDPNRPPLTNHKSLLEELTELLTNRRKLYEEAADIIIHTDRLTQGKIVERIIEGA